jgi:GAF domain-containing protein
MSGSNRGRTSTVRRDLQLERIIQTQRDVAAADLDLDCVMRLICERTQELTGADGATVLIVEGEEFVHRAGSGFMEGFIGSRVPVATSLTGCVSRTGEPEICDDTRRDSRVHPTAAERGIRSMVIVPLRRGDHTPGMLAVTSTRPNSFSAEHLRVLELLVVALGAAMSHAAEFHAERTRTQALSRYRTIFETSSVGMVSVDTEGRLVEVNPAMERMLGYEASELASTHWTEYTHPDDLEHNLMLFRR